MNKFKEVKNLLSAEDVIQKYLGEPMKTTRTTMWYKSPFRNEKTPSFCISDRGIHDFGESRHYDIISFTQRYFNVDSLRALEILCTDFNISLKEENFDKEKIKEMIRQREIQRQHRENVNRWYNSETQRICDEFIRVQKMIRIFEKTGDFNALTELYKEKQMLEYQFDVFMNTDKEILYLERNTNGK